MTATLRSRTYLIALVLCASLIWGNAHAQPATPASFIGDLPCADCAGIRWQLDLFPDNTFFLRTTYMGKSPRAIFDDIGLWEYSPDQKIITLQDRNAQNQSFAIQADGNLSKLDMEGKPIESELDYTLTRQTRFIPIEPRVPVSGMYTYFADSGWITLCETGQRLPVAQEADNRTLETVYMNARSEPGEPVLVTLNARIAQRLPMEGSSVPRSTVIVERFHAAWPGSNCEHRHIVEAESSNGEAIPLQETQWNLINPPGKTLYSGAGTEQQVRPIHITLDTKGKVSGYGGCNRIMGSYTLEGEQIGFGPMASTRMACPSAQMETEGHFLEALNQAVTWKIEGGYLKLQDSENRTFLIFEARVIKQ